MLLLQAKLCSEKKNCHFQSYDPVALGKSKTYNANCVV